jgi:hypothetical protein
MSETPRVAMAKKLTVTESPDAAPSQPVAGTARWPVGIIRSDRLATGFECADVPVGKYQRHDSDDAE